MICERSEDLGDPATNLPANPNHAIVRYVDSNSLIQLFFFCSFFLIFSLFFIFFPGIHVQEQGSKEGICIEYKNKRCNRHLSTTIAYLLFDRNFFPSRGNEFIAALKLVVTITVIILTTLQNSWPFVQNQSLVSYKDHVYYCKLSVILSSKTKLIRSFSLRNKRLRRDVRLHLNYVRH